MSVDGEPVWTTNQIRLQEWLATPRYERIPIKQEKLAEELGVSDKTLTRWKKLPGFMDEVRAIARLYLKDDLAEIYGAISREAQKGNYQMARLALELVGDLPTQGTTPANQHVRVEYVNDWRNGQ
jgi:hypothetical protein